MTGNIEPESGTPGPEDLPKLTDRLSPIHRIYVSPLTHRLVPWRIAMLLMWLRSEIRWRISAGYRRDQIEQMRYAYPESVFDDRALERVARRNGFQRGRRAELVWRPWLCGSVPVEGVERIREAQAAGRPVIVALFHMGGFQDAPQSLARAGIDTAIVGSSHYFREPQPGFPGYRDRRYILNGLESDVTIISNDNMVEPVAEALANKQAVMLAWDMHGRHPVHVFGRDVHVQPGIARVAKLHKALVFPLRISPGPGPFGSRITIEEPIDAAEAASWQELLQELVDRQAEALLAWPESIEWAPGRWLLEDPGRGWRPPL
ncbi:MAG: hypothetical protein V9E83_09395 [Baekduia sp.]